VFKTLPLVRQLSLLAAFLLFSGCLQFTGGDDDDTAVADDDDTATTDDDDTAAADDDDTATTDDDDTAATDDDDSTPAVVDDDGDGVPAADDCDDNDALSTVVAEDADCDGVVTAADCDDNDASSTVQAEDGDCDGVLTAADCDDNNATSTVVAEDADCDGSLTSADCADDDDANYPGNTEICDGADNDCDTAIPIDELDDDGDRYVECTWVGTAAEVDGGDDCDDDDATAFPGNVEICDGIDNDCVGGADFVATADDGGGEIHSDSDSVLDCADCADTDANSYPGNAEQCDGVDNDCVGGADFVTSDDDGGGEAHSDSDSVLDCADCDDGDGNNYPGNAEQCDGADNDCLAGADFAAPANSNGDDGGGEVTDSDNDGSLDCADCEDNNGANYPGNSEVCDGADNDCDGSAGADEIDNDGDGFNECSDGDCNDSAVDSDADNVMDGVPFYPGAPEADYCDGLDHDCAGPGTLVEGPVPTTSQTSASNPKARGTVWEVTHSVRLSRIEAELAAPLGTTMTWQLWRATAQAGPYTLIDSNATTSTIAAVAFRTSGEFDIPLFSGSYYAAMVHMESGTTYHYSSGAISGPVPYGPASLVAGARADTVVPPTSEGDVNFTSSSFYSVRMVMTGEEDIDGDTYFACEECDDLSSALYPSGSEANQCNDGIDNDCDGYRDFYDLDCFIILPPIIGGGGLLN